MSHNITSAELTTMTADELTREIAMHRGAVAKMRMGITMNTEKDTARYRREKKSLARMLTALALKKTVPKPEKAAKTPLKKTAARRTLPAS